MNRKIKINLNEFLRMKSSFDLKNRLYQESLVKNMSKVESKRIILSKEQLS